ncbi:uncharacterized protein LOC131611147 [Vicia villosa]|uniref:uncharacterized protein LOC131611147 n=1 Tax=Vicia villosa TaxID=3911 RepID=UPI00273B3DF0|nr:uncharacterized protein LOC131611147 [Vicia villosa]
MRPRGLEERFAFLAPNTINAGLIKTKPNDVIAYVLDSSVASKDTEKLFFLPYNTGNGGHWLLVAINPVREMDSLDNDWTTYPNLKRMIDTVLQVFRSQRDIQVPKSRANNIAWLRVTLTNSSVLITQKLNWMNLWRNSVIHYGVENFIRL